MTADEDIQYYLWPSVEQPYLLARVHWPDVFEAMSPVLPDWQTDPGLFDLPYDLSSTPVTIEKAAEVAAEWGGRLPTDDNARPLELMRRMPADWSNLSRAEKKAWSIEFVKPGHLITPPVPITGRLPVPATTEIAAPAEPEPTTAPVTESEAAEATASVPAASPGLVVSMAGARRSRRPWRRRRDGTTTLQPAATQPPAKTPDHEAEVIQMSDGREAIVHLDLTDGSEVEEAKDRDDTMAAEDA